jgi:hypothetical protein
LEREASVIEKSTAAYQAETKQTQEALEQDIKLVEGILSEIRDKMGNPKELRNYQIPEYPWRDEIVGVRSILSMDPLDIVPHPDVAAPRRLSVLKLAKTAKLKKPKLPKLPRARSK